MSLVQMKYKWLEEDTTILVKNKEGIIFVTTEAIVDCHFLLNMIHRLKNFEQVNFTEVAKYKIEWEY